MGYLIQGAAIGTDSYEDLQESITIGGNAIVNAKVLDRVKENNIQGAPAIGTGAGIGTSERSDLGKNGLILITGKSKVLGKSKQNGVGIGVGRQGTLNGKVIINGESQADLSADYKGAGLGAAKELR